MGLDKGDWVEIIKNCSDNTDFDKHIGAVKQILRVDRGGDSYPYILLTPHDDKVTGGWKAIELKKVKPPKRTIPKWIIMWDEKEKDPHAFVYTDTERDCIIKQLFRMDQVLKDSIQIWGLRGKFKIKHQVVEDKNGNPK